MDFSEVEGFEWDEWNDLKNWNKHKVSNFECEEVFFNLPFVIRPDTAHSEKEKRFYVLGKTNQGRRIFVACTIRQKRIRVISARDMTKKEKRIYEEIKEDS